MKHVCIRYADNTYKACLDHVCSKKMSVARILEDVFAGYNSGSGREMKVFQDSTIRSLSVADFVAVEGQWFQCASCGWTKVTDRFVFKWFLELERRLEALGGPGKSNQWIAASRMRYDIEDGKLTLNC